MDLNALHFFYITAKNGSISKASAITGHAQPNISIKIQQLETATGMQLFNRHSRGVELTPYGEVFYNYAAKIFGMVDDLENEISNNFEKREKLSIGSTEITLSQRLPNVLFDFHREYPSIELIVTSRLGVHIVENILAYEYDLGFVCAPIEHKRLETIDVFTERLVIVGSADSKFPTQEMLSNETILMFDMGCAYRLRLIEWLAKSNVYNKKTVSFLSLASIINCVAAGMGYSLLPYSAVEGFAEKGQVKIYDILGDDAPATTVLIKRKDSRNKRTVSKFIDVLMANV